MKLDEWMKTNNITQTKLANGVGVYPNQIHNLLKGRYRPKADFAKKIREFTKRQVSLDDIYDIPSWEEKIEIKTEQNKDEAHQFETCNRQAFEMFTDKLMELMSDKIQELLEKKTKNLDI